MHNCEFYLFGFILLELELWIKYKTKLEILVDWSNSQIETNPIFLSNLNQMFQVFKDLDCHLGKVDSDN